MSPATYYNWQDFVLDNVKAALAADTNLDAWVTSFLKRSQSRPDPPEIPNGLSADKSPFVFVSCLGQGADIKIATEEYGIPINIAVQVVLQSPFYHLQGTDPDPTDPQGDRTMRHITAEIQRVLRDQLGLTYTDQGDQNITRQVDVQITGVTPITLHPTDETWMKQTISAVFTVIGD